MRRLSQAPGCKLLQLYITNRLTQGWKTDLEHKETSFKAMQ